MRVLHVIPSINMKWGGPVTAVRGLAGAVKRLGAEVSLLSTFRSADDLSIADALRDEGIDVTLVGPTRTPLRWHLQLAAITRQEVARADVVHIHALWEEVQHQAAVAARALRKPYVVTPHGMLDPWSLAQSALKKRIYLAWRLRRDLEQASLLHFTAEAEQDLTAPLKLKPSGVVVPMGIDLGEFQSLPPKGTFRSRYPSIGNRPLIMFLGRIHPGKGLEYLVPALAKMKRSDAMLVVVGPDSAGFRAVVEDLIQKHSVDERVIFTGLLQGGDRIAALADADLFALPSDHENFGIAVVEALAAGVPVVISPGVKIRDQIAEAGVGSVVSQEPGRLAGELDRWLNDDALRQTAAARAPQFAWRAFDWNRIAEQWVQIYGRLCAGEEVAG